jgi:glutamate formiminotransferase
VSKEKDEAVFQALVDTAKSVPDCMTIDVQTDGNHNRCVFTIVGSPEGIQEVAFQLTKKATELIDMNKHVGQHPRFGATDVIPFIPTMDVTIEECVEISKKVAERIWNELKVPSYLYEESASRPERKNLAACRKGQFEGAPAHVLEPDWAPDFGERAIHPTAGMIAIGARIPLIAYNINLDTPDVEIAKKIANSIRAAKGGFAACKAIGIMLEERNVAQVSMNLVNTDVTPIYYVFEMVKALADRYGARIIGTELVGLTPGKALLDCAEFYLKLENFNYRTQVMEYNLL